MRQCRNEMDKIFLMSGTFGLEKSLGKLIAFTTILAVKTAANPLLAVN